MKLKKGDPMFKRALIFLFLFLFSCSKGLVTTDTYSGAEYIRNYDGDTITFNLPGLHPLIGNKISVRVKGIDTPEIRGKCREEKMLAKKAKVFVEDFLKNAKQIDLVNMKRGKYFRIVADVVVDEKSLGEALVEKKLALPYNGKTKKNRWRITKYYHSESLDFCRLQLQN